MFYLSRPWGNRNPNGRTGSGKPEKFQSLNQFFREKTAKGFVFPEFICPEEFPVYAGIGKKGNRSVKIVGLLPAGKTAALFGNEGSPAGKTPGFSAYGKTGTAIPA
jgi:hypothetical protein